MGLLITTVQKGTLHFEVVNLDEFCVTGINKEEVIKYYLRAIDKYGETNVRLFEVKDVKVTKQADF